MPIALGIKAWFDYRKEKRKAAAEPCEDNTDTPVNTFSRIKSFLGKIIKPEVLNVTLINIANGADNIGIYIPLFRGYGVAELIMTVIIFALLTALWCFIGEKIAFYPIIKAQLQKYKHIAVPIIFIGLGVYIMIDSGLFANAVTASFN